MNLWRLVPAEVIGFFMFVAMGISNLRAKDDKTKLETMKTEQDRQN